MFFRAGRQAPKSWNVGELAHIIVLPFLKIVHHKLLSTRTDEGLMLALISCVYVSGTLDTNYTCFFEGTGLSL